MNSDFSFVIATYNRSSKLRILLDSIYMQSKEFKKEIIVVDQSEGDDTSKLCEKYENILYFRVKFKGLSRARNFGIKKAKGNYIIFNDDDSFLSKDYFLKVRDVVKEKKEYTVFSGIILTIEEKLPFSRYMKMTERELNYYDYDTFLSSNLCIERNALLECEGFDSDFGVGAKWGGSEDADLFIRLLILGNKVLYTPDIVVFHPKENLDLQDICFIKNKMYSYGLGRGAFYRKFVRKIFFWAMNQFCFSILKSVVGIFVGLIRFNVKMFYKHFYSFFGRISGFLKYYYV
jgi:GT2 family glycosyltransferase